MTGRKAGSGVAKSSSLSTRDVGTGLPTTREKRGSITVESAYQIVTRHHGSKGEEEHAALTVDPHPRTSSSGVCVLAKADGLSDRHDGLRRSTQVPVLQSEREREKNVRILLQVIIASWSRANGALVMMVLSKGNLEEFFSIHNTRRPAARGCDAAGELWELWPLIWKSRRRGARPARKFRPSCTLPHPARHLLPSLTARHVWAMGEGRGLQKLSRTQPTATTHSRARAVGGPWDLRRVTRQWLEWAVAPWA